VSNLGNVALQIPNWTQKRRIERNKSEMKR
jgi:hypothetical protein